MSIIRSARPVVATALALLLLAGPATAADPVPGATARDLDTRTQTLKKDVMDLNRDLFVLEEELLFPASTQTAVFVSLDVGRLFKLDSVQVKIDNEVVANYLYTPHEVEALARGGVQRLYVGNLRAGRHEIVAFFTGQGPHDRDYRRGATHVFEKQTGPRYLELQIRDKEKTLQPEFAIREW